MFRLSFLSILLLLPALTLPGSAQKAAENAADRAALVKTWKAAVTQLGSNKYKERITAQKALIAAGEKHTSALLELAAESWKATDDPEIHFRLNAVMEQVVRANIYDQTAGYLGILMASGKSLHERSTIGVIRAHEVKEGSPAEKAGLRSEDEIFEVEGKRFDKDVRNSALIHILQTKRPGDELELGILRDLKPKTIKVTLGTSPNVRPGVEKKNFHQFFSKWWAENVGE